MFKVGDIVYCVNGYEYGGKAQVKQVFNDYYQIESGYRIFCVSKAECFKTEKEAEEYVSKKIQKRIAKYYNTIHSTEDLIKFMFTHAVCPCEEYTDWEAREAVIQWVRENLALELLALELEED